MPRSPRTSTGQFRPGVSGNPNGRPPKIRHDSALTAPVQRTVTRRDGYMNYHTGHGTSRDRRIFTHFRSDIVTDDQALDLWETEFLAARIVEAMPEEAYRRGSSLKLEDEELAEAIEDWAEELGVEHAIVDAWEKENALGGAAIFPVIDGAQGDLSAPLRWDAITDVKALHVLEPRELQPVAFHDQLDDRAWAHPSMYMFTPVTSGISSSIGTQWIHASRLIVFPGLRVSRRVRPGQRLGWGISRLTRPKQVLADFGLAWGSAATLLHEHDMSWLGMQGFADLMATEDGEEIVATRLRAMTMAKSTLRAMVGDKEDTFQKVPSSLSGLADVLNEFKVLMSAASDGMPVSVLMGQSQSGLRSGDDDTLTWYGNVEKRRNKRVKPRHMQALKFLLNAGNGPTGGEEPEVWTLEYPSMWSPSDKEVAETRKTDADRAGELIDRGVVSADDVAESWYSTDKYPQHGDIKVNWGRRRAQAAIAAQGADQLSPEDQAAMGRDEDPAELDDAETAQRSDAAGYNPYRGGNGQFAPGPHADHAARSERASAALQDPAFVARHSGRLETAAHEARSTPGDDVHRAVHAEAMRIHAEHDAIAGDARREELADYARASAHREGLVARHEHAMAALAEDHAAGLEERRAAIVGHIGEVPGAKHDAFLETRDQLKKQLVDVHEGLDRAHAHAAEALHRLRAIDPTGNEHHPGWEHKLENVRDLHEDYGATSAAFAEVTGGHAREFAASAHDEARPFPQREEFHAAHEYENAIAAHENQFKQRAWLAQSALERLHEQQSTAAKTLKDVGRQHDKAHAASIREVERLGDHDLVNEKSFAHYERDRDGEIKDAIGAAHMERAQNASERRVSLAQSERDAARLRDLEDTRTALHEETQGTRDAIRALARITGRKANLGKRA